MKRIINGKLYNTETATELLQVSKGVGTAEYLYRKKNGEFFLYLSTCWEGRKDSIEPIPEKEAKSIIGELDGDLYIEIWGEPEE